ncbi:MAG: transcriptional regulator [Thaumarchaeota archaeon]|nr:transcriptional regulator [Nitrososphaerota archaeon]
MKNVHSYRTHMKIIGDILTTTRDYIPDENGANVTHLIRNANISHGRLSKILSTLVEQGLLEQTSSKRACKYKISSEGREFLNAYNTFNEFAQNFGLRI